MAMHARIEKALSDRRVQYLVAGGLVLLGALLQRALMPTVGVAAPFAIYLPLLSLAGSLTANGPTVLATALCWGCAVYDLLTSASSNADAFPSMAMFAVASAAVAVLARRTSHDRSGGSPRAATESARLAAIVESSDDAIVSKDLDGFIQSWNAGAERIFGYASDEIVGRNVITLIPPERRFEEDHILMRLRRGERVDHFETVRMAKDGRLLDVSLTVSPIRNAQGEVIGASKIARDVSDRRHAERVIAEQEELLRATLSSITDAVITTGDAGAITYLNVVAERLTGFSLSEARGKQLRTVFRVVHEASGELADDPYTKVMRTGTALQITTGLVLTTKEAVRVPIEESAAPILNSQGKITGVVVCFRDITDRRLAANALAEQREWLETTLVSIGDAVIATDIHGGVRFMNPVAEHMTGWRSHDARGQDCSKVFAIVNENTRASVESPVMRVLREGTVVGLANHTMLLSRDGRELPIDDSAAPIRNADGRITGVVLVFHDVAERRAAERDRQNAERERESLLQSERAARAEAERASRVKDQFLATVSHELRTPLNAIIGWIDLLRQSRDDPATLAKGLAVIDRNARVQAQLVSDLLDVSRIVAGKLKLELQVVQLRQVLQEALETVRVQAVGKSLALDCVLDPRLEPVVGDADRLQQIFWNLLSNAIKFTPLGGRVHVTADQIDSVAVITVTDTGEGIDPAFLPHLFERFRQADASTGRRFGGLGLGLTIARQLVELHGGSISAQSEGVGRGTTFTVRLPSSGGESETKAESRASLPAAGNAHQAELFQGLRVLVVEDDEDSREITRRILEEAGCKVFEAGSADEAIAAMEHDPPDVLVSDIGLPGEDGYSLIQRVRKHARRDLASVPAIAVTAFARNEDRARALRSGFQTHLSKPVVPGELLATTASFASLAAGRRATSRTE